MGTARLNRFLAALLILPTGLAPAGCRPDPDALVLAATTSTYDSGLLEHLIAAYEGDRPGARVRTVVTGSGEALELGRRGDVDVLLVHAPAAESAFVAAGHAEGRTPVMYNDFLIVGPVADPAGIGGTADPAAAFLRIADARAMFVSRGDSSGTHLREMAIWRDAGRDPSGEWYVETGQGQGVSLQIASEREAYTLTDRATYSVLSRLLALEPLVEGHESFLNLYSALVPEATLRPERAGDFVDWLTGPAAYSAIAGFRRPGSPEPLFTPLIVGERLPLPRARALEANSVPAPSSADGSSPRSAPADHHG